MPAWAEPGCREGDSASSQPEQVADPAPPVSGASSSRAFPTPSLFSTLPSSQLLGDLNRPMVCLFKMRNKKQSCPGVGGWGWCFRGQWVKSHHLARGIYTFFFFFLSQTQG